MQQNAAESHSVVTTENSPHQAVIVFGFSDSIHTQQQSYDDDDMSQLQVNSSSIHGDDDDDGDDSLNACLPFGHLLPNRPSSMAISEEPQVSNNQQQFSDELAVACMSTGNLQHACNNNNNNNVSGGGVSSFFKSPCEGGFSSSSSSRWDFNKFAMSPSQELLERALAVRTGVHSIPWTRSGGLRSSSSVSNNLGIIFSNEKLSLSLSMSEPPPPPPPQSESQFMHAPNTQQEQYCSEMMSSSSGRRETLQQRICINSFSSSDHNKASPFMQAMQEILAEIAFYAVENQMPYSSSAASSSSTGGGLIDGDGRFVRYLQSNHDHLLAAAQRSESEEKKKKLLVAFLQLVDERYSQCIDEIHTVVSAFHAVTELDPNLHARFALPTISLKCKSLRDRISSQILAMGSSNYSDEAKQDDDDHEKSLFEASFIQKQWALQQLRKRDQQQQQQQLWRPQRGLPERSVSVLRAWMFQNFLHPYPKDAEKHLLALKSGLTRSQVSNWFINARVRLWKPMIEEMYAEMNHQRKAAAASGNNGGDGDDNNNNIHPESAATAALRNHMRNAERRFASDGR